MKSYYVYILANETNEVLYIGVTNNLERRISEHRSGQVEGFTRKYKVTRLVWYESSGSIEDVILREKQLKMWRREKKNALIAMMNPQWVDLGEEWYLHATPGS
ncbi:MAG: GIY-YIG nuclease family protein [Pseudomonadota bacterium]|nr:GIY-YIG nuclease family protein [Pseudomonadota bacterium]